MNFSFENQGTHTYLVYTVAETDVVDTMSLGMLTNNRIQGLATTLFTQMDVTKFIKYDVSAKVSVKQFFAGQVNKKRLISVFNGIVDAMLAAEEYMIDVNAIIMDLDYIFADVSSCETVLVCLPILTEGRKSQDLGMFFKNIMFTTQFDQTENCDHVAKIINYLNSTPVFSLVDFKNLLENINGAVTMTPVAPAQVQQVQSQQPIIQQPQVQQTEQPIQQKTQLAAQQAPVQQKPMVQPQVNQPKVPAPASQKETVQQGTGEKKITMFNLLMHYSKENAELYKKQKATSKEGQIQSTTTPAPKKKKQPTQAGFAIPGQNTSVNPNIAVPGQQSHVATPSVQKQQSPQPVQPVVNNTPSQAAAVNQPAFTPQPEIRQVQPMNFGETTVLGGNNIGETTVLSGELNPQQRPMPHLIREKNNEKVILDKPVFRIGKERSYVDYFISDNTAVSRSHANIIVRDECYYLMDTNSTNHTFLNGMMIQSNVEMKLEHGDKIRLANEGFEFKLY